MTESNGKPKSTDKTSVMPGKNGGTLKVGNTGCHTPRSGRPTNELRELSRVDWELGQKHIRAACEAGPGDTPQQNRRFEFAMEMAAKLGIGFKQENEQVGENVTRIVFGKKGETG